MPDPSPAADPPSPPAPAPSPPTPTPSPLTPAPSPTWSTSPQPALASREPSTDPPASAAAAAAAAAEPSDRRKFVLFMIAAATLLFLGTEAVLYFRSATMREPRCVLVVETAPPLKGAQIKVDGFPLPRALTSTVGENGRFALPFYLDAGTYTVTVTLDGEPQFQGDVELTHASPGRKLDLTRIHPTPAATLPAPDVSSSVPGP